MGADITTRPHGHWRYTRRRVLLKWNVNIPLRPKHIHIHPYVYTLCNAKFLQTVGVARIPAVVGVSRLLVPAGMTGGEFWKNVILSGRASRELRSSLFANSPAESARDALRMWKHTCRHTTHRQIHACTHRKLTCYTYLFFGFISASRISLQRRGRVRQCFQKCLPPPQKSRRRALKLSFRIVANNKGQFSNLFIMLLQIFLTKNNTYSANIQYIQEYLVRKLLTLILFSGVI